MYVNSVAAPEMCGRGRVRKLFDVRGQTQTQPCIQLRTRLTEFVNCTYAMNANKAAIFEFLVIVLTWRETSLMCLLLSTYFLYS